MTFAQAARREAYEAIKPKMNSQERQVHDFLIHNGESTAWKISESTGMLITSVRRALFDLRKKTWVQESGKEFCSKTGANVTRWVGLPMFDYDEKGQSSFA